MKAVIMAGGKGTRVRELTKDEIPKPMLPIAGKPILYHQIVSLKSCGIHDYIIIIGYKGEKIANYFGDGSNFGISIEYIWEDEPLGTAGAFFYLKKQITDDFLLIYGDIVFDIDIERMLTFHKSHEAIATLFVHPSSHPFDSDLVVTNKSNIVIAFDSKGNIRNYYYNNYVNAGVYIFSPNIFNDLDKAKKMDLEKDILTRQLINQKVFAYHSTEYAKDVGTVERIAAAEKDMARGVVSAKNLKNLQKCIFLDRDGTINKYKGFIDSPDKFEFETNVIDAVKLINCSDYLCIVVTNQPVVARGMCSVENVEEIHKKMQTMAGNDGAFFDDIFFCPHHPDKGYAGENSAYKVLCNCRKPAIGMLLEAAEKYNIALRESYLIGDSSVDIKTGKNAHCKTILVQTGEMGLDGKYEVSSDYIAKNLYDAVNKILKGEV